ncbi:MAG: phospholipase D-like domain-containing protein [Planctomycetota bacterium]
MLELIQGFWPALLSLLHFALAIGATVHIVLWKRDNRAAIGWTGLVWLAPLVGTALYLVLGINRIRRKAAALGASELWGADPTPVYTAQDVSHTAALEEQHPNLVGLAALGRKVTERELLPGNRVEPLVDGDEAYPAMLASIDAAERSIAFASYIFDNDRAGKEFLEALRRATQRGVEVRVLIDDVGARYTRPTMLRCLRREGIRCAAFLPTRVPRAFSYANLRNHRKILVVDGRVGFTGGTNIREGHWLALKPKSPVQCLHFRIEGPVVRHMQEAFSIDWDFAARERLGGEAWFPKLDRVGDVWARGVSDGPDEDFEHLVELMLGAVSVTQREVLVVTPYFLPEAPMIRALAVAAMRGADVRVYLPEVNNIPPVAWAAMAQLWQILEKGCRVFFTPPPFDHTKLLVVDRAWSLIGSTNWDPRSLRLNFEYNVECYDVALAQRLAGMVEKKAAGAREITLAEADGRRLPIRIRDGLARLLTPYL